jgi:hypothetical protein
MSKDGDDQTPSIRELEALERQDRKATEDLLSGFDRPGRTPRAPRVRADFVDYYSGRSAPKVDVPPPPSKRNDSAPHEKPTVIVRRRDGFRTTMTWIIAVVGMILFGVTIAVLSTPQTPPSATPSPVTLPPMAPTSATTITSANPQPVETAEPAEPETTNDSVITPAPSAPKKTVPSTTITSGASSAPTIKTAPRDDFIRDM